MHQTESSRIVLPDAPESQRRILDDGGVACWSEAIDIDSYEPAAPDRYPLFLDRRVYQGSSGRVYPIPFVDRIASEKAPRRWHAIHLQNRWVRLMLLPELGGRIHVAVDLTRDYDFFYRNNVVKPALVGLAGPWVSGGVEFNWPQHHRPGTFLPVDTTIERSDDGVVTVWHGDIDPLQRMRARHGIRLEPDSSLVEVEAVLVNRTDEPQTFLWWANAAASIHDDYQSFFPPDVHFVADHARRAITAFPRADRPYYGVDYPALASERPGADRIDLPTRMPVPSSYMITDTEEAFFGGYDHRARAGFVHWADRGISPGKKQWTWGSGEIGRAWDRLLTDDDGPYVELMAGVYTDNQPDFSYLAPGEERRFSQYWYPIQDIGPAVHADRESALSLTLERGVARLGLVTTAAREGVLVTLSHGEEQLASWRTDLAPGLPFLVSVPVDPGLRVDELRVEASGLLSWSPRRTEPAVAPWVASEPPEPTAIASADRLLQTGAHLEQNRHPTREAAPYYAEILRRDPGDARANVALGAIRYRRGEYAAALAHFDDAIERLTERNLNPASGEAHYRRALVLERLDRRSEARADFAKAAWDAAWLAAAEFGLARLALHADDAERAIEHAERSNRFRAGDSRPVAVGILARRRLGRADEAAGLLAACRAADPLDPLLQSLDGEIEVVDPKTPLLVAFELARMGALAEALQVSASASEATPGPFGNPAPIAHLARAQWLDRLGDAEGSRRERELVAAELRYFFPYGLDEYDVLHEAIDHEPSDPVPWAGLGCWLLDAGRVDDALDALRRSLDAGSVDPVAWRNAAVALVRAGGELEEADRLFVRAIELAPADARLCFERDQLAKLRGVPSAERLETIAEFGEHALARDDVAIEWADLLIDLGRAPEALEFIERRRFQPFEGGEGRVIRVFDRAQLAVARVLLDSDPAAAIALLERGVDVPESLGEGRHPAVPIAERLVVLGDAYAALGDDERAAHSWRQAVAGGGPLAVAPRTVDEAEFWIGAASRRLGDAESADRVWRALEARADELERGGGTAEYFATSLPELLLFPRDSSSTREREANALRALAAAARSDSQRKANA